MRKHPTMWPNHAVRCSVLTTDDGDGDVDDDDEK